VPRGPAAGSADLTERLIKLRAEGRKNAEIAATLGVPLTRVEHEIGGLIQTGAVSSRRGLLWSSADPWVKGCERTRAAVAPDVARLCMREDTYEEIGRALARDPTGRPSGVGAGVPQAHGGLLSRSLEARRVGGPRTQPTSAAGGFSHFHPAVGAVHRDTRRGAVRIRAGGADEPARGEGTIKELAQSIGFSDVDVRKRMHEAEPPNGTAPRSPAEGPAHMNGKTPGAGDGRPGAAARDTRRCKTDGRSGR